MTKKLDLEFLQENIILDQGDLVGRGRLSETTTYRDYRTAICTTDSITKGQITDQMLRYLLAQDSWYTGSYEAGGTHFSYHLVGRIDEDIIVREMAIFDI